MQSYRIIVALLLFSLLFYSRSLWFPLISPFIAFIVTVSIAWRASCSLCKRVILQKLPNISPDGKAVLVTGN